MLATTMMMKPTVQANASSDAGPTVTAPMPSDELCWQALCARDHAMDGRFWYSVLTTGVYCRPSCAARRPRRENVAFHASPAAARRAGFRACRRCRPDEPSLAERRAEAVATACRRIDAAIAHGDEIPSLEALATQAGFSPFHFHRVFRSVAGVTPKSYVQARRAARMQDALDADGRVTDAIYEAGYGGPSRFYETATARLGMTPTTRRKGGAGTAIRFAIGRTSLGHALIAATDKGLCAVLLGDDAELLLQDLQDRFPKADLIGSDAAFEALAGRVLALIDAPASTAPVGDLPLDIRGTAFQERVWRALRDIPAGHTVSYAELAERIGRPSAVRAVARACAGNPIAVAIPCHRVVRTDGGLSGYRWGIERKRELLAREAAAVAQAAPAT